MHSDTAPLPRYSRTERIVFFGTPEFVLPVVEYLHTHFNLVGIVTQPDKPVGRKKIMTPVPTKTYAQAHGIPLLQPVTLSQKKEDGIAAAKALRNLNADLYIVAAYGKILPQAIIDIPARGCINIHPSLLPMFRGATPIQTALLHGLTETGTTIMRMDAGMDTGDILAQESLAIQQNEFFPSLNDRLWALSTTLLSHTLPAYIDGFITPTPQQNDVATFCEPIERSDGEVFVTTPKQEIMNKLRAYTPWPGVFIVINGTRVKILDATYAPKTDTLTILTVQREGKNPQSYTEFTRIYPELQLPFAA